MNHLLFTHVYKVIKKFNAAVDIWIFIKSTLDSSVRVHKSCSELTDYSLLSLCAARDVLFLLTNQHLQEILTRSLSLKSKEISVRAKRQTNNVQHLRDEVYMI